MTIPTELPTEGAALEAAGRARAEEIELQVDLYEKPLITFVVEHVGLAIQFAILIAVPVGLIAFAIGRHVHP
jgi:hypothetical protein